MAFLVDVINYAQNVLAVVAGTPRTAASVNGPLQGLVNRTAFLKHISDKLWGTYLTVSGVDTGLDTLNIVGHGLSANQAVRVTTIGGSIPAPLNDGVVYYVIVVDSDNLNLSLASGPGAAVDLTGPMAGDVYVSVLPDWQGDLLMVDATYGTGIFASLVMWLAGTQTVTGAKTFDDITANNQYKYNGSSTTGYDTGEAVDMFGMWSVAPGSYTANTNSTTDPFYVRAHFPHEAVLEGFSISYQGAAGHGGLPATMPKIILVQRSVTGTLETPVATATDASASAVALEANHLISSASISVTIDTRSGYTYWWKLQPEAGANSLIGGVWGTPTSRFVTRYVDRRAS